MPYQTKFPNKKDLGNKGEQKAVSFFESNGFEILGRNFRCGKLGEIDIIAKKDNLIIFAEVKSRNSLKFGGAYYSVSEAKKQTIKKVARSFLTSNPEFYSKDFLYRFDLVAIENGRINWIEDIIR